MFFRLWKSWLCEKGPRKTKATLPLLTELPKMLIKNNICIGKRTDEVLLFIIRFYLIWKAGQSWIALECVIIVSLLFRFNYSVFIPNNISGNNYFKNTIVKYIRNNQTVISTIKRNSSVQRLSDNCNTGLIYN